ncbi:type II toxin-antitoxin system Phd/YefM family antitoxin [Acidobacteriota bacterium]
MRTVNALKIRNNLGEVLDSLEKDGEPILVSKGRKIRAVLITPEEFKKRFLDKQVEEEKKKLLQRIKDFRADSIIKKDSINVLRGLRGYEE